MPVSIRVGQLRCEDLIDPLGIGTALPRLGWIPESDRRGSRQTAFRVLVASNPKLLRNDQGDLWDSGRKYSDLSSYVRYGGRPLQSREKCFWKVRLWDETGQPSAWSAPAKWSVGLLRPQDWSARWIGLPANSGDMTAPWLRRTFRVTRHPLNALIYANFMGYGEIYLNGQCVGDDVLGPPVCDYSKRSFYTVYDVTGLLRTGRNCLALWLGRGWYRQGLFWPVAHDGPIARVQLEWNEDSGAKRRIVTDGRWEGRPSCLQLLGAWSYNQFGGEIHDATTEVPDWNNPAAHRPAWPRVALVNPPRKPVCAPMVQPNRVVETLRPAALRRVAGEEWLVDMGKACTGWVEVKLPAGEAGRRVVIEFGDAFERSGRNVPFRTVKPGDCLNSFNQRSEYVYRGHGPEIFRNHFNYASFRYIRISNVPRQLDSDSVSAFLITTDLPIAGEFSCSNRLLNRIHDTMRRTLRCLMLGGYQVDCHSRERLGYGGDGQSSLETTLTMLRSDAFYRKWTADWLDAQRPDGGLPHTAPCPVRAGGGPFWCGFLVAATWRHYLHYGDLALVRRNYPAIVRWLEYVGRSTRAGLLRQWPDANYRAWYLGDWAVPEGIDQKHPESIDLFCNCYIIYALELAESLAGALGRRADAGRWRREAARRRPAVHRAFYHPAGGVYADGDQIDLVMPLLAGVVPKALRRAVFRKFEHELMVKHKGHLATGLSGTYMMIQFLQATGRNDLIYAFASKTTAPSWGNMLRRGATATWEYWTSKRSRIHNCYNSIGAWFYQGLAGIYPDPAGPGFRRIIIRPALLPDLKHVRAAYDSVRGRIECDWRMDRHRISVEILIPAGARATVQLPARAAADVLESGRSLSAAPGVEIVDCDGGWLTVQAASGRYRFSLPRLK